MNWGVRSMVWYVIILVIAFLISLFFYHQLVNDPIIEALYL